MNYRELEEKVSAFIPGASLDFDLDGQIVIYTGLAYDEATREVVDFVPDED